MPFTGAPPSYNLKGIPYALPEDPYTQISYRSLTFNNPYWAYPAQHVQREHAPLFGNTFVEFTPKINWSNDKKLSARWANRCPTPTPRGIKTLRIRHAGQPAAIESNGVTNVIFNSLFTVNYEMNIGDDFHLTAMAG